MLKQTIVSTGFLYLVKISFKNGGIINTFSNKYQENLLPETCNTRHMQRNSLDRSMKSDGNLTLNSKR